MRGRPTKSTIRQNVVEILHYLDRGYGYEISKLYNDLFPEVTQRSIYYHLRKGIDTKEFKIHRVEKEKGEFSWGNVVEKTYYTLGGSAQPKGLANVKAAIQAHIKAREKSQPTSKRGFMKLVGKFRKER
jgi:hypothetical protein